MKKLELKHIAPYLPYDLKGMRSDGGKELYYLAYVSLKSTHPLIWNTVSFGDPTAMDMKPILRPLSYLTKEIEVNGEKFVPIIELAKLFHISRSAITHFSGIRNDGFYGVQVNCHIENDDGRFMYYQIRNEEFILSNTYEEVQKLLEWHFDVFGLIEQGLAIDINTLEK
jgi:hypothetical protein